MQDATLSQLENLFMSLSDKTRLRLLSLMAEGEVSVGFLADSLGESQPKISRHLAYLRNAGLVSTRRDGKWIYYEIELPSEPVAANVLNAALGLATPAAAPDHPAPQIEEAKTYEAGPKYYEPADEETTPYEPEYVDDWRPEELEVYLL